MICPRWLVQSSAMGVVGAALIAVPLWINAAADNSADEPIVRQTSFEPSPHVTDSKSKQVLKQAQRESEIAQGLNQERVRTVRVRQVRTHRVEAYRGPQCPTNLDIQRAEALQEARTLLEESRQRAEERRGKNQRKGADIDDALSR